MNNLKELKNLYTRLECYIRQIKEYKTHLKCLASNSYCFSNSMEAIDLIISLRYKIEKRIECVKAFNKTVNTLTRDEYNRIGYWLKFGPKKFAQRYPEISIRTAWRHMEKIASKILTRFKNTVVNEI